MQTNHDDASASTLPNIDIIRDRGKLPPLAIAMHTALYVVDTITQAGLRLHIAKHDGDTEAMDAVFNELAAMAEDALRAYRDNVTPQLPAILAGQAATKRNGVTLDGLRYATAHEAVGAMLPAFDYAPTVAGATTPTDAEVRAAFHEVAKWSKAETVAGLNAAIKMEHANAKAHTGQAASDDTATPATPTPAKVGKGRDVVSRDDDEQQVPALTKAERATLAALASFDPSRLASAIEVSEAMPGVSYSERSVRKAIKKLVKLNLAERPEGEKQGARLTIKGRLLASKLAD